MWSGSSGIPVQVLRFFHTSSMGWMSSLGSSLINDNSALLTQGAHMGELELTAIVLMQC